MKKLTSIPPIESVIDPDELQRIRDSAVFFDFTKGGKNKPVSHISAYDKNGKRLPDEAVHERVRRAVPQMALDWLRFPDEDRDGKWWKAAGEIVRKEASEGRSDFRRKLGKVLSEPKDIYEKLGPLEWFLIKHWATRCDVSCGVKLARSCKALPELCRLSNSDLELVCRAYVSWNLKKDAVIQTRRRLGLHHPEKPSVKVTGLKEFKFHAVGQF